VRELVYRHLENTESARAREILGAWPSFAGHFRKVRPKPPVAKPAEAKPPATTEAVISENVVAVQP
jgi:glutamate synthase domain-containing protein 3